MTDNYDYNSFDSTGGSYNADADRNQYSPYDTPVKKDRKAHPTVKKFGMMLVSGMTFGLAAALVFIGILKASGMDKTLATLNGSGTENVIEAEDNDFVSSLEEAIKDTEIKSDIADGTTVDAYSVSEIAQSCMPSIVSIKNKGVEEVHGFFGTKEYESNSVGSGIIIGENDTELLIATNNHVIMNAKELSVCFGDDEEKVVNAKVKGRDENNDLAIIAINSADLTDEMKASISIAKIGSSDNLQVGDQVVAIGNALGYGQSVTTGIVSAKDRDVTIEGKTAKLIQTDAAINPGNSGGALLNMKGELIGINSSKFASEYVEGMGYAIPIDTAEPILSELMTRETRDVVREEEQGFLGISCQNVSDEIAEMYNIPKGVYILEAAKGKAAANAGLQKGDILTKFDGITISDYDELKRNLQYYKVGETVEVVIQRAKSDGGYEEKKISVTLTGNTSSDVLPNAQGPNRDEQSQQPEEDFGTRRFGSGYSAEDIINEFFGNY